MPAGTRVLGDHALPAKDAKLLGSYPHLSRSDIDGEEHEQEPEPRNGDDDDGRCYLECLHLAFPPVAAGVVAAAVWAKREVVLSVT